VKRFWLRLLWIMPTVMIMSGCTLYEAKNPEDVVKPSMMVDVMLQECEGITILGKNPIAVNVGADASFAIKLHDGYKIDSLSQGAIYENGTVTLKDVRFPTTVEITPRLLIDFTVAVNNDSEKGKLTANVELGTVRENTEVTLNVAPIEGFVFLGYSVDAPRSNGGTIICASTEYTFTMTKNTVLYTNYYSIDNGRLVVYDGNGAVEDTQYYVFDKKSPYIGPNAWANKGQFTREGYVLYGYNTEADGSGIYYGPGWSVVLPEDPNVSLTLYAQWMPVTQKDAFIYTSSGGKITITGYQGDHETVVIPETIDEMPVVKIAKHAFCNGNFKTVYLSRNLKTIEKEAFLNCESLVTLYMCDTPTAMPDEAFTNCNALQRLNMLACVDPRYSNTNDGMYKIKYQRLLTAQRKKIIFQGGSNVAYGVDIPTIHDMLDDAYEGVNFGCRQSSPAVFFIEVAAAHMNSGDVLVFCPEYHQYQYGFNEMNAITWQIFEGAYNAYADVDIRNYTKVFSSFAAFNTNRYKSSVHAYEQFHTCGGEPSVTKFGVYNVNHHWQAATLQNDILKWKSGTDMLTLDLNLLSQDYNANMNRVIDMVLARGGKMYISFPSVIQAVVRAENQTNEYLQEFKATVSETFPKATVISDPGTFIMDNDMFYNSCYHLTTAASKIRSKMLAEDILAQFAMET